ncbi:hypothetical protein [Halorarum halobium]|uniref:hypothetical protein n=1 Tax=Halorarum halobium TaxID=3075121 RepID=UPI0028AF8901|nr:hypothetical protein [Halobaculum sp. XH14]
MSRGTGGSTGVGDAIGRDPRWERTVLALGLLSALLFGLGLQVTEAAGEFAVDVDLKPFFIPYLLVGLARFGIPTLSVGLGAALGEGVLDVFEGYELDDPIGFIGYVVGFVVFGWYLDQRTADPTSSRSLVVAAVLGALAQAVFEGSAFLIFDPSAGPLAATLSVLGNTVTHGVLLGAIPLVLLHDPVRRRFGAYVP